MPYTKSPARILIHREPSGAAPPPASQINFDRRRQPRRYPRPNPPSLCPYLPRRNLAQTSSSSSACQPRRAQLSPIPWLLRRSSLRASLTILSILLCRK
ncbi:hypothetical protein M0R45_035485 [Rubus argutus]|uniref:Uncharacterized protein n=1 Tax=Rubus argutus TaxID=59490 RepID=A0AAW1VTA1_RUBAR